MNRAFIGRWGTAYARRGEWYAHERHRRVHMPMPHLPRASAVGMMRQPRNRARMRDKVPAGSYNLAAELIANGVPCHRDPVTVTIIAAQTITADPFTSILPPWLLRSVTIDMQMETNWSLGFCSWRTQLRQF
jgi:hypothetical protein